VAPHLEDAKHWRFCAEELRTAADDMLSDQCRAMALRIADGYDCLARHAEDRVNHKAAQSLRADADAAMVEAAKP
jgi:hypothetical protein